MSNVISTRDAFPAPRAPSINSGSVSRASGKSSEYGTPSLADDRQRALKCCDS